MKTDPRDPFAERVEPRSRARLEVLGVNILIESTDVALSELALEAYGGLPGSRTTGEMPAMRITMVLNDQPASWGSGESPPPPLLSSGGGILCATVDAGNFSVIDPANARALICVSRAMLKHSRLARYELIEFAVLTLASRRQSLVPLHAASVGVGDVACLILGRSGAGKSSLCLLGLQHGMFVLSEDSAFVRAATMEVFGTPNFLHVRADAGANFVGGDLHERISASPVIERRSGVEKFELDLRTAGNQVSHMPLRLGAIVSLLESSTEPRFALRACDTSTVLTSLRDDQPYAAGLPEWSGFCHKVAAVPCYELHRTDPPGAAIGLLRALCA